MHEAITNLGMDGMTMMFTTADPAQVKSFAPGDRVVFEADRVNGKITVVRIEAPTNYCGRPVLRPLQSLVADNPFQTAATRKKLCAEIIQAQRREIEEMQAIRDRLGVS